MAVRDALTRSFSLPKSLHRSVFSLPLSLSLCIAAAFTSDAPLLHSITQCSNTVQPGLNEEQRYDSEPSDRSRESVFISASVCAAGSTWRECNVITELRQRRKGRPSQCHGAIWKAEAPQYLGDLRPLRHKRSLSFVGLTGGKKTCFHGWNNVNVQTRKHYHDGCPGEGSAQQFPVWICCPSLWKQEWTRGCVG